MSTLTSQDILDLARRTLSVEAEALSNMATLLGEEFIGAVNRILDCRGKVIITGMGKSGYVARKIAATLTSTGMPSVFLHPAEAAHGDLGIIADGDVIVALSYSGETNEIVDVARFVRRCGNGLVAMTGDATSSLAMLADVHLDIMVKEEDSVLNIVPTASTTAQLAMGDAIATAMMYARNFQAHDFGYFHPGGYIERRIKMTTDREVE